MILGINYGLKAMEQTEMLPFLYPQGTKTKQMANYDLSGSNDDGNFSKSYTRYVDSNGEYVIFDDYGPGCLYRQQMNVWYANKFPAAGEGRIRYYFDDEDIPRIDMSIDDFFDGSHSPFNGPYCFMDSEKWFAIQYYPFPFRKRLKVTTTLNFDKLLSPYTTSWYQYTYLVYPEGTNVESWKGHAEDSEVVRSQWINLGSDPKDSTGNIRILKDVAAKAGETVDILNLTGQGSISAIRINMSPYTNDAFYNMQIRIFWDNSPIPAVDMPIGYFFGGGGKDYDVCSNGRRSSYIACNTDIPKKSLNTLFFGYDGEKEEFYSYWPMPYWSSAKIEIVNKCGKDTTLICDIEYKPSDSCDYPRENAGYFHARRTIDQDSGNKPFITAFEESGKGHVVGLSFFTDGYAMDGDEFTYIDGSRTPQIHGSGTEDDHNQGWGGKDYQKPLWGGLMNGYQGAYRIYMNDPYIFNSHIKINYEFSNSGGGPDGGRSDVVTFYYKSLSSSILKLTDRLDVGNLNSEKLHDYEVSGQTWEGTITSGYDGYEKDYQYDTCTDSGRAFKGCSRFVAGIDPENNGVRLRKRINKSFNGIQKVNVHVDGIRLDRPWYICMPSTSPDYQSWLDTEFEIPAAYTRGKSMIRLEMECTGGMDDTEINEFRYWVFSHVNKEAISLLEPVTGLYIVSEQAGGISLGWNEQEPGSQILRYKIYRSTCTDFSTSLQVGTSDSNVFTDRKVRPGTTYYYRISSIDVYGNESSKSSMVCATSCLYSQASKAEFIGDDSLTSGNWGEMYGKDGFIMLRNFCDNDCKAFPIYLSDFDIGNMKGRLFALWMDMVNASLRPSPTNQAERYLGCLQTDTADTITLYINDNVEHRMALYFCDYDRAGGGRVQDVEILDLRGNSLYSPQRLTDFADGIWLKYKFIGCIKIRIINMNTAANAVISAIMFDS